MNKSNNIKFEWFESCANPRFEDPRTACHCSVNSSVDIVEFTVFDGWHEMNSEKKNSPASRGYSIQILIFTNLKYFTKSDMRNSLFGQFCTSLVF